MEGDFSLSGSEIEMLRTLLEHEGWDVAKKVFAKYEESYLNALVNSDDEKESDQFRGNIQVLRSIKAYLESEIKRYEQKQKDRVEQNNQFISGQPQSQARKG